MRLGLSLSLGTIATIAAVVGGWILATGTWDDSGSWIDTDNWID